MIPGGKLLSCVTRGEFERMLSRETRLVPFYADVLLDTESPMSVFMKLCGDERGYLLESVEGGKQVARYSFIGASPLLTLSSIEGTSVVVDEHGERNVVAGNPFETIRKLLSAYYMPSTENLPRFAGGLVGHLSYDLVRFIEDLPGAPPRDLPVPDLSLMACRHMVVFDHVTRCAKIILNLPRRENEPTYEDARAELLEVKDTICGPLPPASQYTPSPKESPEPAFSTPEAQFLKGVKRAKDYIRAGDIFQVVLSQRAEMPLTSNPLSVYRVLRTVNPSPYMFYINAGQFQLAGDSPEMLVRLEDGIVDSKPIAGTRGRGADSYEDAALEKELLSDEKEQAEHVMLVDLSRNDLGRVCEFGSVKVPKFLSVERFSHVMHIVSEVRGQIKTGLDSIDVVQACFPAGTLSGAPKVRAMEIIDELEDSARGPYGGAVGYFGFTGNMDTCITIRTALMQGGKVYVQAGAGIVFDSDPRREHRECMDKAKALFSALKQAQEV